MKTKKFKIIEDRSTWLAFEVFAESKEDADDLYFNFYGEEDIIKEVDRDGETSDFDVKEIDTNGMEIKKE